MCTTQKTCANCHKAPTEISLKRCAKCKDQWYCDRDCQRADWQFHMASCGSSQQSSAQTKAQANTSSNPMPNIAGSFFKSICSDNYLHQFSEKDAFRQLIDCYRMRVEDDYVFSGDTRGLYNGDDPLTDFRDFLDLAEKRSGVLPSWWSPAKRKRCEKSGLGLQQWSSLSAAVEKQDIIEEYGDPTMPMKLRLLADEIYGRRARGTWLG